MIALLLLAFALVTTPAWADDQWEKFSPRERYDALQHYRRHQEQPVERRKKIERQYERWRSLPEEDRERIRENYERYQALPSPERERLEKKHRKRKRKRSRD